MATKTDRAIRRIQEMEAILDECTAATRDLIEQLDRMEALRSQMTKLFRYYGSDRWHADRALDERGALPVDLKRGVLSEDLVYDAITDARDAAFQMLELGADVLKNRI